MSSASPSVLVLEEHEPRSSVLLKMQPRLGATSLLRAADGDEAPALP